MQLDELHLRILKDVASFASIKRYRGMMPARLAMFTDKTKVDELVELELIERMHMSYPCGSEETLLEITSEGRQALAAGYTPVPEEANPELDLSRPQLLILNDIYHFCKISRFRGMMPPDELVGYNARDVNTLFAQGYVIKVKADMGGGKKRKGLILSDKGVRAHLTEALDN